MVRAKDKHELPFGLAGNPVVFFPRSRVIFMQGDPADAVFYILEGTVRLTVLSKNGKEAILAILGEGEFFGEGSLGGQGLRMGTASAMTHCQLLRINKKSMALALHRDSVSDLFIGCLLARNVRIEQDLVDQLFNSSEKRLARVLLLLSHYGEDGMQETAIRKINQGTLAEMVGTTRSRVNFFMNRFRTSGFINYGRDGIQVHHSLLNFVLKD
jgi:CRP/FNR family cyclic AMP-dependent transcriptional regulator